MTNPVRDSVLAEALADIPRTGFSQATLAAAAKRAGVGRRELSDAFPDGAASLVEAFSHWADLQMAERMREDASERLGERIKHALRARIEVLIPHKDAARRAVGFLALPQNAALAARLMMRTVDAIWRAAGDVSSDFSYYTKRATLSGVYAATFAYWLTDSSEGNKATWAFLDQRMRDVQRLGQLREAFAGAVGMLPDPFGILKAFRSDRL